MDTFRDIVDESPGAEPSDFKKRWYEQRQRILSALRDNAPHGAIEGLIAELSGSGSTAAVRQQLYRKRCPSYGTYKKWMNEQIPKYLNKVAPQKTENEWQNYILHPHASFYKHEDIERDSKVRKEAEEAIRASFEKDGWCLELMNAGEGCTNREFNRMLIVRPPHIQLEVLNDQWDALDKLGKPRKESEHLLSFACAYKPGIKENDAKIRLASDFMFESSVDIQETNYFSSLMTDQLAWKRVHSTALQDDGMIPEVVLWDGTSAFIDTKSGRLKGFGDASISNQLGASTLAFSMDDHLIIVYQNAENSQSAHMLAPSGSGSLDWKDVERCKEPNLLTLVRNGAERELREECALNGDGSVERYIRSNIMVTGFVRMLHRAGKPEFFCLARLDAPASEIVARKPKRYGERFVEQIYSSGVRRESWSAKARPRDKIVEICRSYLEKMYLTGTNAINLSYPLEHALRLLIDSYQDEECASVLDRFMQAEFR